MLKKLMATEPRVSSTLLRLGLAIVIFPHGAQKLFGWFGGNGLAGTVDFFREVLGIPAPLTFIVILVEFFGALALAVGLFGRLAALGIAVIMVVAALMVHVPNGFFMNWYGVASGEGYEYHILVFTIALVLVGTGSGWLSLDAKLAERRVDAHDGA